MDKNDMVKKLHEKSGISEADARDALERSSWDMLDALQLLENEGKIQPLTASMTTVGDTSSYEQVEPSNTKNSKKTNDGWNEFVDKIKEIMRKSVDNSLIVRRRGEEILSVPVLIFIIVAILEIAPLVIAFIIGFIFECSYSIEDRHENKGKKSNKSDE